uniref:Immunoglobulin I-set domain-containing protein n=1 Tax=Scylla olivacea TaxID=85551 RepID=A0A0P4WHJ2_SCYOL
MKDGRKRQLVFKSIAMEDAGNYSCRTNADETACETIVQFENKFKKPLQDQMTYERQPATFEVELVDPDAPLTWFIKGEEVKPGDNFEIVKNGAVHKLIIKEAAMDHEGEIKAVCGNLETSCQLSVGEGEKPPSIKPEEPIEGPVSKPLTFDVPYTSKFLSLTYEFSVGLYSSSSTCHRNALCHTSKAFLCVSGVVSVNVYVCFLHRRISFRNTP